MNISKVCLVVYSQDVDIYMRSILIIYLIKYGYCYIECAIGYVDICIY